jgi:murein DD-endopeptidase MepM/ murein hydrolase activator NlpD
MAVALLSIALPSSLEARTAHRKKAAHKHSPVAGRHATVKAHHSRAAGVSRAKHSRRSSRAVISQDASGKVVLDRYATPAVYGPFYPGSLQNYPEPPCEATDVVVEVTLHEPGAGVQGEEEPAAASEPEPLAEPLAKEPATLSRIAQKLGSFFRPKSSEAVVKPADVDLGELLSAGFQIPVEGVDAEKLQDSFLASRGRHNKHLAIDIGAPRGTPVLATTDGEIVRVSRERRGGKAIYQKDASGRYLLFYCHLSRYAEDLAAGQKVKKGDVIGFVGSTGHVIGGSHLHFSITKLPQDDSSFKRGLAINPYLLFLAGVP